MKKQYYGDKSSTAAQLPENIKADIEAWLMKNTGKYTVIEYKYKEDSQEQISYAVRMPKPDNNKIGFDSNTGKYVYYVNQVTFSVDVFMDKSVAEGLSEEITKENYEEYIAPGQTTILEEKDGDLIRIIDLDERKERQNCILPSQLPDKAAVAATPVLPPPLRQGNGAFCLLGAPLSPRCREHQPGPLFSRDEVWGNQEAEPQVLRALREDTRRSGLVRGRQPQRSHTQVAYRGDKQPRACQ